MKKILLFIVLICCSHLNAQIANPVPDYLACDDISNDGAEIIDLTTLDAQALGNQDPDLFSVSYHTSQQDADLGLNALSSPYTFLSGGATIFVRVQDASIINYDTTSFNLFLQSTPVILNPQTFDFCGFQTATGIVSDLSQIESTLSNGQTGYSYGYYFNQADADSQNNPIFEISGPDGSSVNVFVRAESFNGCATIISVLATISTCNQVIQLSNLEACEDANGLGCVDLSVNDSIALGNNSASTHAITYHLTQAEADNNIAAVPPTYCSQLGSQLFIVRVEEIATGIADTTQSFFVTINNAPNVFSFAPITGCLQPASGSVDYDGSSLVNHVLNNSTNFNNVQLVYYLTQIDAENQVNPLGVHFNFSAPTGTTIVYVRTEFRPTLCAGISPVQLIENTNCFITGTPAVLTGCLQTPNTVACFDLTVNDAAILDTNNPASFTLTYHNSISDANAGTNAIAAPNNYCVGWSEVIHARLEENVTGAYQTVSFDLIVQLNLFQFGVLNDLSDCDADLDGLVTFDLTDFESQLNTMNPLSYYTTSQDAQNGTNALQTPTSFDVPTANGFGQIFILETIAGSCNVIYNGNLRSRVNCNNAYTCDNAQSLCERIGQPFVNVFDGSNAEPGNYYPFSSGAGPRNPTWFYIPIETSGDLTLEVFQNTQPDFMGQDLDIDFAVYGPFTNPTSQCGNLSQANYVDHSFSVQMPEIAEITNAVAGEYYLILTSNFSSNAGFLKVEIGATSSATINCDGIRMQSFLDTNLNGTVDASDPSFLLGVFEWEKNSNGNVMQVATPLGSYNIYDIDPTNSYDLAYNVLPAYTANYTVSPATYTGVTIPNNSGVVSKDFLVTPVAAYDDVVVYIVPQEQPRPGFTYTETVYYTNLGTSTVPVGQVIFDYDPTVSVVNVSDPNAVVTPTSVTLPYSNLTPFALGSFDVEMQIPVIPTVSLGDVLTNVASISPIATDLTPANNTNTSAQIIIGSYDPNDKMESRGEFINPSTFTAEDYFYYTIRFENTGTASAINVRIEDTLDAQLDWNSIEMINSSHAYIMERMENQVVWRFDNIMLPDATTDPIGANGHVYFRIKPLTSSEGTMIPNTAEIYFDFNPPIITNTFRSTFRTPLSNSDVEQVMFSLTPNPASNQFTVNFNNMIEEANLTLYDVRGRVTLSRKLTPDNLLIDISNLDQGIYLAKFTNGNKIYTSKLVKK